MTKTLKIAGGLALAFAMLSQPLAAQTRSAAAAPAAPAAAARIAPGIGIADLNAAIENSTAFRTGMQQAQTYYKPAIDAAQAKFNEYNGRLKTMVDQLTADSAAKKPDATLQQEYAAIKTLQSERDEQVANLLRPYNLAEAYIREQITGKLSQAVQNVAQKRGVTLLLHPDTVYFAAPAYDVTAAVVQELNVLVPTVQYAPPAGWLPREMREQQAQQGAAPAAPAARPAGSPPAPARPAGPQPEGR